jgi:hypothetical protein
MSNPACCTLEQARAAKSRVLALFEHLAPVVGVGYEGSEISPFEVVSSRAAGFQPAVAWQAGNRPPLVRVRLRLSGRGPAFLLSAAARGVRTGLASRLEPVGARRQLNSSRSGLLAGGRRAEKVEALWSRSC